MKQIFITAALFSGLISCNNGGEKNETPKADSTTKKDSTPVMQMADTAKPTVTTDFPGNFTPEKIFSADKADLHESLKVQQLSEKKIAYEVRMENGGCTPFTFKGVATLKEGDAESDEDEKGNGYFVAEYVDDKNGNCTIYLRIGADKGYTNRAKFNIADCAKACKDKTGSELLIATK